MRNLPLRLVFATLLLATLSACGPGVIDEGGGSPQSGTLSGGTDTGGTGSGTTTGGTGGTGTSTTTGGSAAPACGVDTWTNYAQKEFATNCVSCHSFASTLAGVQGQASQISSMVNGGEMPPAGALNQNDVIRIVTWISCNTPN